MAFLFCDSFAHYNSMADLANKWGGTSSSLSVSFVTGRNGSKAIQVNNPFSGILQHPLGVNAPTTIVGFALQASVTNTSVCWWGDGVISNTGYLSVIAATGQLQFFDGNGNLRLTTSASGPFVSTISWNYVEVKVTHSHTATGSVTININGVQAGTVASVITSSNGSLNDYAATFNLHVDREFNYFGDVYICDATGTTNNTFLGDVSIKPLFPSANGRVNQWTNTGGATHWQSVNNNPPDGDTTYINSSTVGQIDDFAIDALPSGTASVLAAQVVADVRKDDSASRTVGLGVGNNTTENFDAGTSVPSSYAFLKRPLDINPITGVAWAVGDFTGAAAIQLAAKVIA